MPSLYFSIFSSSDLLDRDKDKALEDGESTMWKDPGSLNRCLKNYVLTRINQTWTLTEARNKWQLRLSQYIFLCLFVIKANRTNTIT